MSEVRKIRPDERLVQREPKDIYNFRVIRILDVSDTLHARILCTEPVSERDILWKKDRFFAYEVVTITPTETEHVYEVTVKELHRRFTP